jgi:hypothetical protein
MLGKSASLLLMHFYVSLLLDPRNPDLADSRGGALPICQPGNRAIGNPGVIFGPA